ncbi:alpha/beta hydrolase [Anabaena sp. UHCC 0399]|uniref:alpha/beta hydrolase n=1 Tax=Anabaena sp. UHCC 0399 TaxID=3110238 RepID=UPI002B211194|nr:alpha/beta hydrolase [Anabaena sp. UHCC 0399]MEA5568577.1 alpha/beta hydrolase [Anabaena sp. UHCC 0399]
MNSLLNKWTSSVSKHSLLLVLSILLPTSGVNHHAIAAERVYTSYSGLELSISVATLEVYAKTGFVNEELAIYQQYLPPKQFQELRQMLHTPVKVSSVVLSQFLYTPQGEFLLRRLGEVIQSKTIETEPELNALRSALVLAASEPEGLTLLNLLRKYPTNGIYINLAQSLTIAGELQKIVNKTHQAIAVVTKKSNLEASSIHNTKGLSQLPDLANHGKIPAQKYTLKFFDSARHRLLLTDVYLPRIKKTAPVIVISHGLGSDSSNFQYLATHLASHGFAVVVPNHPSSDAKQVRGVSQQANEVISPEEFQDRPLDVKYVLNQLEISNQSDGEFKGKLNLQEVGVFGQSLGGYTALALAGGKINFGQLQQDCKPEKLNKTWNMSVLFQCRALGIKNKSLLDSLQDKRVKAAIAVNPITSSIFGKSGINQIKVPVMLIGSSEDTIAPALYEQILPFSWLASSQKYLAMLVGGTHFTTIGNSHPSSKQVPLSPDLVGDAVQAHRYMNILSLPFFQTYVANNAEYAPYLSAAYAKTISSHSLGLSIVKSLTSTELAQGLGAEPNTISPQY